MVGRRRDCGDGMTADQVRRRNEWRSLMAHESGHPFEGVPVPKTAPTAVTFNPLIDPHFSRGYTVDGQDGYSLDFSLTVGTAPDLDWRDGRNHRPDGWNAASNGWNSPLPLVCECHRGYRWLFSQVVSPVDGENRGLTSDAAGRKCSLCDRHIPGQWGGCLELLSMSGEGVLQGGVALLQPALGEAQPAGFFAIFVTCQGKNTVLRVTHDTTLFEAVHSVVLGLDTFDTTASDDLVVTANTGGASPRNLPLGATMGAAGITARDTITVRKITRGGSDGDPALPAPDLAPRLGVVVELRDGEVLDYTVLNDTDISGTHEGGEGETQGNDIRAAEYEHITGLTEDEAFARDIEETELRVGQGTCNPVRLASHA